MEFLERINWNSDDGVFFPMLMDFARNQYFDEIIKDRVQGRHCVDVGFGTGMLSLLALKHGASHVTAYESDDNRYALGRYIIDSLGLSAQIDLRHHRFSWQTDVEPDSVVISETVNTQLWGEGLWSSIPRSTTQTWLPGQVFMEVVAEPIAHTFAQDLFRPAEFWTFFNPAVDLDQRYIDLINHLTKKTQPQRETHYHTDNNQNTVWGGWTYSNWAKVNKQPRAGYTVNLGTQIITISDAKGLHEHTVVFNNDELILNIELPQSNGQPILVVPRVGLRTATKSGPLSLYLDTATSWGGGCTPLIVTDTHRYVTIKHCVRSGLITYSLE